MMLCGRRYGEIVNRIGVLIVCLVAVWFATVVAEQPGLRINRLNVGIWPEYDDPRVLVIYHGEFDREAAFPVEVEFKIPRDAEIVGTGIDTPGGGMLLQDWKIEGKGDYDVLWVQLSKPTFFLEYYYDPFSGGAVKSFEHEVRIRYPVDDMVVRIRRPLNSRDFKIDPAQHTSFGVWKSIPTEDSEGFMNYHYGFKDLKAGAAVRIAVSYKREVSSPSIIKTKRAAPGPVTEPDKGKTIDELIEEVFSEGTAPTDTTGTGMSGRTLMGIILLAVAVAIVISVIFKTVGKRSGEHAKAPLGSAQPDGKWQYCPQCGAGLARDHKFCPDCGNRIGR